MSSELLSLKREGEALRIAFERRPSVGRFPNRVLVAALAFGAVLSLLLLACGEPQDARVKRESEAAIATPPPANPRVVEVASHFQCPCGSCEHMDLMECQCKELHGATEIKAVIVALLDSGLTPDKTIARVAAQYGGLKTEALPPQPSSGTQPRALPSQ